MSEAAADTRDEAVDDGAIRVRRALISVSDKTGVADFAKGLAALGVEILSTGGTATALREAGLEVTDVSEFTGQEEILGGRVKTLHPRLHAALLARREDPEHMATLEREGIEPIDLVCVNLYPFEQTVAGHEVAPEVAIENIDIGGPTMIRAAAKNHEGVAVVVKPESYDAVCAELEESGGEISATTRHWLANEAFAQTARYDAAISRWFSAEYEDFPEHLAVAYEKVLDLSYGENPHQRGGALLRGRRPQPRPLAGLEAARQGALLQQRARPRLGPRPGRRLRAAGLRDRQAQQPLRGGDRRRRARGLPEGAGLRPDLRLRRRDRLQPAGRPRAGRGAAQELRRGAERARLRGRRARGAAAEGGDPDPLRGGAAPARPGERDVKRVLGGLLIQDRDGDPEPREIMEVVTKTQPSEEQWHDLLFAWTVVRHVRSNAIVIAKDGATLGIGAGQMSRVDSVRLAVEKCRDARGEEADALLAGSALASDAFFPFADGPELAIQAGATAVIQPGGSKRDAEVIEACDAAGVAMVFTKHRHFRH